MIGAGVFFAAEESHKVQIFLATTIKGLLVALLAGFSLNVSHGIWFGAMYGLLWAHPGDVQNPGDCPIELIWLIARKCL